MFYIITHNQFLYGDHEWEWVEEKRCERVGTVKAARFSNGDVLTGLAVFSVVSPAAGEKGPSRLGLESRSRAS